MRKSLVLFVEGDGDKEAVPVLVKRLLTEKNAWDCVNLDSQPFVVGEAPNLAVRGEGANRVDDWVRWLRSAQKRSNFGGVLLLLDGDCDRINRQPFCASRFARELSQRSKDAGAGKLFSVASVFACQEYESWLIAGVASLAGKALPDGRPGIKNGTTPPEGDLENNPRGAKGWLSRVMTNKYKPTRDQKPLTELVSIPQIRERQMRSFRRLENALSGLIDAFRSDCHIISPNPDPS